MASFNASSMSMSSSYSYSSSSTSGFGTSSLPGSAPSSARSSDSDGVGLGRPKMICPAKYITPILPAMGMEARNKLQNFEFHLNWFCLPNEIVLHESELDGMISAVKNNVNEMLPIPKGEHEKHLKEHGLAPIMCNNALAFLFLLRQDFAIADDCLVETNQLLNAMINKPLFSNDHAIGMFYLVKGLKLMIDMLQMRCNNENDNGGNGSLNPHYSLLQSVESFEDLSPKARAAILAAKAQLFKLLQKKRRPENIPSVEELICLDPDYYEWRIYQYLAERQKRMETSGPNSCPGEEELKAIENAWNLSPSSNPFCMLYMCQFIAEKLRYQVVSSKTEGQWTLRCGPWSFASEEQAVKWIKSQCFRLAKDNNNSIKINVGVADIIGILLPLKYRDPNWSRECIFQSYRLGHQVSSSACHRMAIQVLQGFKTTLPGESMKTCEDMFQRAFFLNLRNYDALLQFYQVMMRNPREHYNKIRWAFANSLSSFDIPDEISERLLFLKGCFHVMAGEFEAAILTWVSVYVRYQVHIDFKLIQGNSYVFRTFQWPYQLLNLYIVFQHCYHYYVALLMPRNPLEQMSVETVKPYVLQMLHDQCEALSTDEFLKAKMSPDNARALNQILIHLTTQLGIRGGEEEEGHEKEAEREIEAKPNNIANLSGISNDDNNADSAPPNSATATCSTLDQPPSRSRSIDDIDFSFNNLNFNDFNLNISSDDSSEDHRQSHSQALALGPIGPPPGLPQPSHLFESGRRSPSPRRRNNSLPF